MLIFRAGNNASFRTFMDVAEDELLKEERRSAFVPDRIQEDFRLLGHLMLAPIAHAKKLLETLGELSRLVSSATIPEIARRIEGAQMNAARCLGAYASKAWDEERIASRARGKAALLRFSPAVYANVADGRRSELATRDLSSEKACEAWALRASFDATVSFDSTAYLSLPSPSRSEN